LCLGRTVVPGNIRSVRGALLHDQSVSDGEGCTESGFVAQTKGVGESTMTPEEIKQANALIAQVVWEYSEEEYEEYMLTGLGWFNKSSYALMELEDWLMTQEVSFVSHFEDGQYYWFAKTWHSTPSGNVCKEHKGCADSNMEAKYQCFLSAIRWIVEQAGSIEAAREWKP
jgi:hypothetical protein